MRRTRSDTDIPSRSASILRSLACGRVNVIDCLWVRMGTI